MRGVALFHHEISVVSPLIGRSWILPAAAFDLKPYRIAGLLENFAVCS